MTTITKEQAQKIIDAADKVITALAGTNEDVHPDNSQEMIRLYDDLNDHYAPPVVVRELARIALASLTAVPVAYNQVQRDMMKDIIVRKLGSNLLGHKLMMADIHAVTMTLIQAGFRTAPPASERERIRREHAEWSDKTFGDVGPVGPLKHLSKEALEAAAEPDDLSEWADMQFLLWDAQRRAGITDEQIAQAMVEKLAVNKQREWPEPKDGEPRLHIKEQPAPVVPETLPCSVELKPGLIIGKGCKTETLLSALQRRYDYNAEIDAMTPEERAERDAGIEAFKAMLPTPADSQGRPRAPVVPEDISGIIERFQYQADHLSDWHHIDEHSCKVNRRDLMTALEFMDSCRAAMLNGGKS
ncbi:TPA: DUF550 domain-containing protein [Salmonella enterica subsp. enterica serovar Give]